MSVGPWNRIPPGVGGVHGHGEGVVDGLIGGRAGAAFGRARSQELTRGQDQHPGIAPGDDHFHLIRGVRRYRPVVQILGGDGLVAGLVDRVAVKVSCPFTRVVSGGMAAK